jgi:purine-binding chemotaxis protein CheW
VILETRNNGERQDIGVVVDAVNEVIEIPDDQIEPPPRFGTHIASEYIAGMAKVNGHFVVLLDLEKILSMDDLAQLTDLTQPPLANAA